MKRTSTLSVFSLFFFGSLVLFLGCKKHDLNKISDVKWDPNLAVPIGYGDFGAYDLLAAKDSNDLIIDQTTRAVSLEYKGEIASISAQEVVDLNDHTETMNLAPSDLSLAAVGSFSGVQNSTNTSTIDFPMSNGIELHDLNFENGTMNLNVSTTLKHDIALVLTFQDLTSNGVVLTKNMNLNYTGSVPQTASATINLANVLGDFTAGNSAINRLRVSVASTITGTNAPIVGNENFDLSMGLTGLEFKNITGYFGQQSLAAASDSILLKIFNNAINGDFTFTNPSLKFVVENSFGIPMSINFNSLQSINAATGQISPLSGFPNPLVVNKPSSFGQTATTSLTLDNTNTSNMATIITPTPKYLKYGIDAVANPSGNIGPLNFIEKNSKFVLKAELSLPMEGFASNFSVSDTMPLGNLNLGSSGDMIDWAMMRFNIDNGFPVGFNAQVKFIDTNGVTLFNLFSSPQTIIGAASVDGTGKVNAPKNKITDAKIAQENLKLLKKANRIIITGIAETTAPSNSQIVKFYDNYRLKLKLGMQVQLKSNIKI